MLESLKKLRRLNIEKKEMKYLVGLARADFSIAVLKKQLEIGIWEKEWQEGNFYPGYSDYNAEILIDNFPSIFYLYSFIKEKYPKTTKKDFRLLLADILFLEDNQLSLDIETLEKVAGNFILYEECDFEKLKNDIISLSQLENNYLSMKEEFYSSLKQSLRLLKKRS